MSCTSNRNRVEATQSSPDRSAQVRKLLERHEFRPRWPWVQADLQTLRNFLPGVRAGIAPESGAREEIRLRDGSGDRLAVRFHAGGRPSPAVVLLPGLTGCEASPAVLQAAEFWLKRGHPALRVNLRGSPPVTGIARSFHHMGRVADLADVCTALLDLRPELAEDGLVIMGFSLGGALALRLGASDILPDAVRAIVTVSAPLEFEATARRMSRTRNRLYERWLLSRLMAQTEFVWRRESAAVQAALRRSRHIRDFDEALTSRVAGYRDAAEYYANCSPIRETYRIRIPTLLLHADDDPWVPPPEISGRPPVHVAVSRGGGHVGFHGMGSRVPWHLRVAEAFLREMLA